MKMRDLDVWLYENVLEKPVLRGEKIPNYTKTFSGTFDLLYDISKKYPFVSWSFKKSNNIIGVFYFFISLDTEKDNKCVMRPVEYREYSNAPRIICDSIKELFEYIIDEREALKRKPKLRICS